MATKSKLDCAYCQTEDVSVECKTCDGHFCKECDEKFHNHPNRQKHIRNFHSPTMAMKSNLDCLHCQAEDVSVECVTCGGPFCKTCDAKFHNHPSHPDRQKHIRKVTVLSTFAQCNSCGSDYVEYFCTNCEEQQLFCTTCDCLFHEHQERQGHVRKQFLHLSHLTVDHGIHCCHCHSICTIKCKDCSKSFCKESDEKYHDYPNMEDHTRKELKRVCSICQEMSLTVRCDECDGWYCDGCDDVRHKTKLASHIKEQIQNKSTKDSITHEKEAKIEALENSFKSLQVQHNIEIQTKDSLIQEYIAKERRQKEQTDSIVQKKEARIQVLENTFKSLQDKHQVEKVQHNREIQTKDSLIEEHIIRERRQKEQTESLEKENRDLQEQIKTLKIQVTDKGAELQRYLPREEGTWMKYSGGDVPVDGVVADDSGGYKWYLCRAEVDGDVVPGQIRPSYSKECRVYHNGEEHYKSPCEMLVPNSSFKWISCHGDEIPPRAVPGGKTKKGEVLYVGRVKQYGSYHVGKVVPSLSGCYTYSPVDGDYTFHPNYAILVWK